MSTVPQLLKQAESMMKSDLAGAIAKLDLAYAAAADSAADRAMVAEELSRAWSRRKSPARSMHYARMATKVASERKAAWTTLAKTCELVATRTRDDHKKARAQLLFRLSSNAFKKAAALTKDPEDKRWLMELARDAAKNGAPSK